MQKNRYFINWYFGVCLFLLFCACQNQASQENNFFEKLPMLELPFDTRLLDNENYQKQSIEIDTNTVKELQLLEEDQKFEEPENWTAIGKIQLYPKLKMLVYSYANTSTRKVLLATYNDKGNLLQKCKLSVQEPSHGGIIPENSVILAEGMIETQMNSMDTEGVVSYTIQENGMIKESGRNLLPKK